MIIFFINMVRFIVRISYIYINFFQILTIHISNNSLDTSFIYIIEIWSFLLFFMQITFYFLKCHFMSFLCLVMANFDRLNWNWNFQFENIKIWSTHSCRMCLFPTLECLSSVLIIFSPHLFRQYIQRSKWTNRYEKWSMVWSYSFQCWWKWTSSGKLNQKYASTIT